MVVRSSVDDRVTVVGSGVLATVAMVLFLWSVDAITPYRLQAPLTIAELLNASPTVGLALFALIGVLVWPLVFFVIGEHLAPESEAMRGVVLSLILWMAFAVIFLPSLSLSESVYFVVLSFLGHLIYGSVLGASFAGFGGEHR